MQKLTLKNFKAFQEEIVFSFDDNKNFLLYGENGAGKSSLFEALKLVFFQNSLEAGAIVGALTQEEQDQRLADFRGSFNNKITNDNFTIVVNEPGMPFNGDDYQAFLVSIDEIRSTDELSLPELLQKFHFPIQDLPGLCATHASDISLQVNTALASFKETVKIVINEEENFSIVVYDESKNIRRKSGLKKYFNEAKLNLIILLIVLHAVLKAKRTDKKIVLVLDDFITSLDSANRTFLIKFIIEKFSTAQLFLFTHNISFYNLVMYILNELKAPISKRWIFANLYEIENKHKIYVKNDPEKVRSIVTAFNSLATPQSAEDIESIGNKIRKKFETFLSEFAKLISIGAVEETKNILSRLAGGDIIYYKPSGKNVTNLLAEIRSILGLPAEANKLALLQAAIDDYTASDLPSCRKIVRELKLYQKVTMHPMSHAAAGMPTFTIKEIKHSLELLATLESYLEKLKEDVVTV